SPQVSSSAAHARWASSSVNCSFTIVHKARLRATSAPAFGVHTSPMLFRRPPTARRTGPPAHPGRPGAPAGSRSRWRRPPGGSPRRPGRPPSDALEGLQLSGMDCLYEGLVVPVRLVGLDLG